MDSGDIERAGAPHKFLRLTLGETIQIGSILVLVVLSWSRFENHVSQPCHDDACANIQMLRESVVKLTTLIEAESERRGKN